jgi:hypothetical protein
MKTVHQLPARTIHCAMLNVFLFSCIIAMEQSDQSPPHPLSMSRTAPLAIQDNKARADEDTPSFSCSPVSLSAVTTTLATILFLDLPPVNSQSSQGTHPTAPWKEKSD